MENPRDAPEPRRVTYVRLDQIRHAPRNPKGHADGIGRSITHHGLAELPLRDDRTGLLVAGHGRHDHLQAMHGEGQNPPDGVTVDTDGMWLMPVITGWASRSDADAEAYLIASNQLTTAGGWDDAGLAEILGDLQEAGLADLTGFTSDDITSLMDGLDGGGNPFEYYDPARDADGQDTTPPDEPVTQPGDVWKLGRHRLICGDCRDDKIMTDLMDGHTADLVLTDPPYGVAERTDRASKGRGLLASANNFAPVHDDDKPFDPSHLLAYPRLALFGANSLLPALPPSPAWIIWDKLDGLSTDKRIIGFDDNADAELAWTNLGGPARIISHRWKGAIRGRRATRSESTPPRSRSRSCSRSSNGEPNQET